MTHCGKLTEFIKNKLNLFYKHLRYCLTKHFVIFNNKTKLLFDSCFDFVLSTGTTVIFNHFSISKILRTYLIKSCDNNTIPYIQ